MKAYLYNHFDSRGGSTLVIANSEEQARLFYEKNSFNYGAEEGLRDLLPELLENLKDELDGEGNLILADGLKLEDLIGADLMELDPMVLAFQQDDNLILAPWPLDKSEDGIDYWNINNGEPIDLPGFGRVEHIPTGEDAYGLLMIDARNS